MASGSELNLSCPVCHDIYEDPVLLPCSHSFCVDCLHRWWRRKEERQCPVCKRTCGRKQPPRNSALRNLCEAFLQEQNQSPEDFCSLHSERFKFFCLDHQEPVCLICRDSEKHTDHRFRPIDEAASNFREELQKSLKPLKEKLKVFQQVQGSYKEAEKHIKHQAKQVKKQIRKEIKMLHELLEAEEDLRISAVREEEREKCEGMKKKMETLRIEISCLSDTIRATKEDLRAEDAPFLLNYKAVLDRVQYYPLLEDPQLPSGALLDEAKHLGNLKFNIWTKMNDLSSPVILDPNTAHPGLRLSEDLSGVEWGGIGGWGPPDNPERFDSSCLVLSSEGFTSGLHSWEVEVGESQHWVLGVASKSVTRVSGLWTLALQEGTYKAFSPSDPVFVLPVKTKLHRIRVCLYCDPGVLMFYDSKELIHTFICTSREPLFPFLGTRDKNQIKILPNSVTVINDTHNQEVEYDDKDDHSDDEEDDSDDDSDDFHRRFTDDDDRSVYLYLKDGTLSHTMFSSRDW